MDYRSGMVQVLLNHSTLKHSFNENNRDGSENRSGREQRRSTTKLGCLYSIRSKLKQNVHVCYSTGNVATEQDEINGNVIECRAKSLLLIEHRSYWNKRTVLVQLMTCSLWQSIGSSSTNNCLEPSNTNWSKPTGISCDY